jgi:hypothetical protein
VGKRHAWEKCLSRDGLPDHIGYEAERHGHDKARVLSLDVYPHLSERTLATWDRYEWDQDETPAAVPLDLPDRIQAIAEKRLQGETLSAAERKALQRFRDSATPNQPTRSHH